MNRQIELTAVIEKEDNMYISLCPELDIASQGHTPDEAKSNLMKHLSIFMRRFRNRNIRRLHNELQISKLL